MIRTLVKYLPPLEQLKKEVLSSPHLLEMYLSAEILRGDVESVEYIEQLKKDLDSKNDKSN